MGALLIKVNRVSDRSALRQQMRLRRQQITFNEQQRISQQIAERVCSSALFQQSAHIAAYSANAGEIDPAPIVQAAWQLKKKVYLPVLQAGKKLCFVEYKQHDSLVVNQYQILEPVLTPEKMIAAEKLDLVLVPLVAFDQQGNRLGMGSGYYDSTFAFLQEITRPSKPYLLGLAYEWQCCASTFSEAWDVKLDAAVTENIVIPNKNSVLYI